MKNWAINQLQNGEVEILLYGYIGSDDINANELKRELMAVAANTQVVKLRINSGGGSVFEGVAIFNAIRETKVPVHAYIDGICASMASVIILACEKIYMSRMAMMMTHRPSGFVGGNASDLKNHAKMLEDVEAIMCEVYARRTGLTPDECRTRYMGLADNWMNAEQCLAEKLIDGIYDAGPIAAPPVSMLHSQRDLVTYFTNYITDTTRMKPITLSATALAALNLAADAADTAAVEAALTQLVQRAQAADALKAELHNVQQQLRELEAAAVQAKAEALIDGAVAAQKITATDRDKYVKLAVADYATTHELVAGMKPYTSIESQLHNNPSPDAARIAALMAKTGKELYMAGELEELRKLHFEGFKAKYKEYWGAEYPYSK